jgi:UPF0271 protein
MKDINCDLGEGEPPARTRALMKLVTSANIACGGHAGDAGTMRGCLDLCRELGVRAGAHPGFADRENFGRKDLSVSARELEILLLQQMGAFATVASSVRFRPHHVKLHGALYHLVERSSALAKRYVHVVQTYFPGWRIYALPSGAVVRAARAAGVGVWREVFADRAYRASGLLVSREEPGAVIWTRREILQRVVSLRDAGILWTAAGSALAVECETLCVHADSPRAVKVARLLAQTLSVPRRAGR